MIRTAALLGSLFSVALFAACQSAPEAPPPAAPQPAPAAATQPAAAPADEGLTTRSGIYTAAQAERGVTVFEQSCSSCHSPQEWQDASFLRRWNGQNVHRLYTWIHENMPNDAPRSLTPQQYADVLAYIFKLNKMPAGNTELGTGDELYDVLIDWGS